MFAEARVTVEVPFPGAVDSWRHVQGRLGPVTDEAYGAGVGVMTRVGPFGELGGLSKRVELQMLEPVPTRTGASVGMRWIATGASGRLFPVLDADIELSPLDAGSSELHVVARYEAPLGPVGAHLDRTVLRLAAEATLRSFLRRLARILAEDACATANAGVPGRSSI